MSADITEILIRVLDDLYASIDRVERLEKRLEGREAQIRELQMELSEKRAIPPAERKA